MDYVSRLAISYYNTITAINSEHNVYLVQHRESQKIYIKKILDVYNPHIYEYLQNCPVTGIPKLYGMYEENGQLTIIEEFISGTSLQEILDTKALSVDLIIRFMSELCDILGKLHSLNPPIIHRDIKPSNIIITPYDHVVLIDFNAAKYLTNTSNSDTVLLGTKGYAAPEQYGFGSSTPQTDIYALGVLLKELSTALPSSINIFDDISSKCIQLNPDARYENVSALKAEIVKLKKHSANNSLSANKFTLKQLIPPGFRTRTPWKMVMASAVYLFILWVSLTLEAKDGTVFHLWLERIFSLFVMLSIIFCCFNYCNVQHSFPLCKNRHPAIHYLGVLLLNIVAVLSLLVVMVILEDIF